MTRRGEPDEKTSSKGYPFGAGSSIELKATRLLIREVTGVRKRRRGEMQKIKKKNKKKKKEKVFIRRGSEGEDAKTFRSDGLRH